ncbi:serine hydrolase domain-containing protein [Pedobacter sp. AW1-32]|uniref:serine hydrolase domain-containing protein n=1 Tax=Pedobacter sp. AW1-32 TaxID=3383026 RepID=UPI003FF114A9
MEKNFIKTAVGFFLPFITISTTFVNAQETLNQRIQKVENSLKSNTDSTGKKLNLQSRMKFYNVNGISIAVIHNYKVDFVKAYGWADKDNKTKLSTQTLFQAASISKSFNAVAIIKLYSDKGLNLFADINQYLKSWKFPYDSLSQNKKINTANLLSHTAGLGVHGFGGYEMGDGLPTVIQILNGQSPANSDPVRSEFAPGMKQQYSGGGTTISQLLLTDISGSSYQNYLKTNVLVPLGMISSTFEQPPIGTTIKKVSTGYDSKGVAIKGKYHVYPEQAAAGLWTNPTDLAKYIIDTQLALEGRSKKVLNQKNTRLRLTPYQNDKGSALGIFIEDHNGEKYFGHGGSNRGFQSAYYGSMSGGNGLVIMVNSDNGEIIPEIINSITSVYKFKGW